MKYFIFIFVIAQLNNPLEILGQFNQKNSATREVTITQDNNLFKFNILVHNKKVNHSSSKDYYWYSQKQIKNNQGGSSGFLLHGLYESFNTNYNLLEKGQFKYGVKNGEWNYWDENGVLVNSEFWEDGVLLVEEIEEEVEVEDENLKVKKVRKRKKGALKQKIRELFEKEDEIIEPEG